MVSTKAPCFSARLHVSRSKDSPTNYPLYVFRRWKRACAQEQKVELPPSRPSLKRRSLVRLQSGKRRELPYRRELGCLLVSRLSALSRANNIEVLYLNLDKKIASSNSMRKKRDPSQNRRQAPPTSRERRGLRLLLSRQEETSPFSLGKSKGSWLSLLSFQKMEQSIRSKRKGGALPQPTKRTIWSSAQPSTRQVSPPPHAPK